MTEGTTSLFECADPIGGAPCENCGKAMPCLYAGTITVTHEEWKTPLWFRQSLKNTLWLLTHQAPWHREWWATLIGLCPYCFRWDCID